MKKTIEPYNSEPGRYGTVRCTTIYTFHNFQNNITTHQKTWFQFMTFLLFSKIIYLFESQRITLNVLKLGKSM